MRDALNEAYQDEAHTPVKSGGIEFVEHQNDIVELTPPRDLQRRFDYLPQDYVQYRKVMDRLMLATTVQRGNEQLKAAREGSSAKSWPQAHFLGPLHPVSEWAADRALASMEQNEIPAARGNVDVPTMLLMGTLTNSRGQVLSRTFITTSEGIFGLDAPAGVQAVDLEVHEDVYAWLMQIGLIGAPINAAHSQQLPQQTDALVAESVKAAHSHLAAVREANVEQAHRRIDAWKQRENAWGAANVGQQTAKIKSTKRLIAQEEELLRSMAPERSLVRPLALILPAGEKA